MPVFITARKLRRRAEEWVMAIQEWCVQRMMREEERWGSLSGEVAPGLRHRGLRRGSADRWRGWAPPPLSLCDGRNLTHVFPLHSLH